ncbi:MAG: PQQ-binding-like beta-propeller repeat protein, partial [Verrucomicrobia bacterium]
KKWQFLAGDRVYTPVLGPDGTVYVGSWDSNVVAVATSSAGSAFSAWPMFGQNAQHARNGQTSLSIELVLQGVPAESEFPKITVKGPRGTVRTLTWSSVLGVNEVWQALTNVVIGPNGTVVVDLAVGSSPRYYRIR